MRREDHVLLETERLVLRRMGLADLDNMSRLNGDPEVMRYVGDGSAWTRAQSEARIRRVLMVYRIFPGLGFWIGEEKISKRFVGAYALIYIPNTTEVEVGYRLSKSAWGRGLATEGARALVRYGMFELGLNRVVGLTHPANEPSKHVLMKAGLQPRGMGHYYDRELCYFVAENGSLTRPALTHMRVSNAAA
ncbi:MAG: GNAT family N-acetyltransferase [Burkholderiales bacterium]|nr:GNAT family N-acetyltransferase [Burkholderiales bacterium]